MHHYIYSVQLSVYLFAGPPLVSDNGMSNALKAPAIDTKRLIVIVGINNGNWI